MKWTTELPTESGWYFYRDVTQEFPEIHVGYVYDNDLYPDSYNLKKYIKLNESIPFEWAGPIPEPEE